MERYDRACNELYQLQNLCQHQQDELNETRENLIELNALKTNNASEIFDQQSKIQVLETEKQMLELSVQDKEEKYN